MCTVVLMGPYASGPSAAERCSDGGGIRIGGANPEEGGPNDRAQKNVSACALTHTGSPLKVEIGCCW